MHSFIKSWKSRFYSFFVLLSFSLLTFSNGLNWLTYGPISTYAMDVYQVDSFYINLLSVSYMFIYPIGAPCANVFMAILSSEYGLIFGALLNCIGAVIRCFSYPLRGTVIGFSILLLGQLFCSMAQSFIIGMPPMVANRYFSPRLRPFATAIGVLMNGAGIGFSFLISPLAPILKLGLYQIIIAAISCLGLVMVPLSFYQHILDSIFKWTKLKKMKILEEKVNDEILDLIDGNINENSEQMTPTSPQNSLKQRLINIFIPFKSIHFLMILFSYGVNIGSIWALLSVLDQILDPLDYTPNQIAVIGVVNTCAGLLGVLIAGILGSLLKHLRTLLKLFYLAAAISMMIFSFSLKQQMYYPILLSQFGLGFFSNGIGPIALELSSELFPDIDEAIPPNHVLVFGNIVSILVVLIVDKMQKLDLTYVTILTLAIISTILSLGICLYYGPYKRSENERKIKELEMKENKI